MQLTTFPPNLLLCTQAWQERESQVCSKKRLDIQVRSLFVAKQNILLYWEEKKSKIGGKGLNKTTVGDGDEEPLWI